MFGIGTQELLLILLVVLLLFGARRIPSALGGLGKGIREFKKGLKGDEDEAASPEIVAQLKTGLGKQIRLLPDGTLEVGSSRGRPWSKLTRFGRPFRMKIPRVRSLLFR